MPRTLLLADDSVTIQRVIELTFAHEDVRVVAVNDGAKALEWIRAQRPDIVLADVAMPEVDGYGVAKFVKETPALRDIPVLLLAGAFEPVDDDQAREAGADGVFVKPFEPQQLVARVKELLGLPDAPPAVVEAEPDAPLVPDEPPGPRLVEVAPIPEAVAGPPAPEPVAVVEGPTPLETEPVAPAAVPLEPAAPAPVAPPAGPPDFQRPRPLRIPLEPPDRPRPLEAVYELDEALRALEPLTPSPEPVSRRAPFGDLDPPVAAPGSARLEPETTPAWAQPVPAEPPRRPPPASPEPPAAAPAAAGKVSLASAFSALLAAEHAQPSYQAPTSTGAISEAALEEVVRRVVTRMTDDVVRRVVLDAAERLIREEIERIKLGPDGG